VEPSPPLLRTIIGLIYQPWMRDDDDDDDDDDDCGRIDGMKDW
jgi:hypothetical protein